MTCALLLDMFFTAADLARLRRCLTDTARLAGLAEPRRSEFVLAVHETLEFDLAVTRRDTPGLASAAAPGAQARR